jgi:hypothetical protein
MRLKPLAIIRLNKESDFDGTEKVYEKSWTFYFDFINI